MAQNKPLTVTLVLDAAGGKTIKALNAVADFAEEVSIDFPYRKEAKRAVRAARFLMKRIHPKIKEG